MLTSILLQVMLHLVWFVSPIFFHSRTVVLKTITSSLHRRADVFIIIITIIVIIIISIIITISMWGCTQLNLKLHAQSAKTARSATGNCTKWISPSPYISLSPTNSSQPQHAQTIPHMCIHAPRTSRAHLLQLSPLMHPTMIEGGLRAISKSVRCSLQLRLISCDAHLCFP